MLTSLKDSGIVALTSRRVLAVVGPGACNLLQGLLSNDVTGMTVGEARYAGWFSPNGRLWSDMIVIRQAADSYWLEVPEVRQEFVHRQLNFYKLRSAVTITSLDYQVIAAWGKGVAFLREDPDCAVIYLDPRAEKLGVRALVTEAWRCKYPNTATERDYRLWLLAHNVPDATRDYEWERSTALESGFDRLHGISWSKGCFMGQELAAIQKYRGEVRKELRAVCLPAVAANEILPNKESSVIEVIACGHETEASKAGRLISWDAFPEGVYGMALLYREFCQGDYRLYINDCRVQLINLM